MPAVNWKGKESEQSKQRRNPKKPQWKLGWGLLEDAKKKITAHQAKTKKSVEKYRKK